MSIKSVMPSNHLILCRPLLLLPAVPPSIRVFSNKSTLRMRWPKYWSFSFSISPPNEHTSVRGWHLIKRKKVTNAGGEWRKRNSYILRRQEVTDAGLGVEEKENLYTVSGDINQYRPYEIAQTFLKKIQTELP